MHHKLVVTSEEGKIIKIKVVILIPWVCSKKQIQMVMYQRAKIRANYIETNK